MDPLRYYQRPTQIVEPGQYVVAFLDILGFKRLLDAKEFTLINILFEEIADAIYYQQRMSYRLGYHKIGCQITNFSDSIILFSKLFEPTKENYRINNLAFNWFHLTIRDVMATGMRLRIPLRGAVAFGELYAGKVASVTPDEVWRGPQVVPQFLLEKFPDGYDSAELHEKKILSAMTFPVHFGAALTEAYLLESSVNSIGIFMEPEEWRKAPFAVEMDIRIRLRDVVRFNVDDRELLAFNWCNRIDYETYREIDKFINEQSSTQQGRVGKKWKSLAEFVKIAPKK